MGFKTFLLNEGRSKAIDEYEAVDLFKANCKDYRWGEQDVVRGVKGDKGFKVVDPSKSERVSANTQNYYTLWIDNSPKWKEYPKRSKSLICASHTAVTIGYGSVYYMIPYDGATVGIASQRDFWYSFPKGMDKIGGGYLNEFNDFVYNILDVTINDLPQPDEVGKSWKVLNSYIKKFDMNMKKKTPEVVEKLKEEGYDDHDIKFIKKGLGNMFNAVLDPKENGFKVMPFKNYKHEDHPMREVWTDSPCIMIPYTPAVLEDFKNKVA